MDRAFLKESVESIDQDCISRCNILHQSAEMEPAQQKNLIGSQIAAIRNYPSNLPEMNSRTEVSKNS